MVLTERPSGSSGNGEDIAAFERWIVDIATKV